MRGAAGWIAFAKKAVDIGVLFQGLWPQMVGSRGVSRSLSRVQHCPGFVCRYDQVALKQTKSILTHTRREVFVWHSWGWRTA
jgi:hypothetical protein